MTITKLNCPHLPTLFLSRCNVCSLWILLSASMGNSWISLPASVSEVRLSSRPSK